MDSNQNVNLPAELAAARQQLREAASEQGRLAAEMEKLKRLLAQGKEDLAAAQADLETFAHSVSHDLRAPLRHIQGYFSFLEVSAVKKLDGTERQQMEKISTAAQHMGRLIEELVAFARIGRAEINRRPVNMSRLVAETLATLQPDLAGRNIVWNTQPLPEVPADANLLRQVWLNLIGNAVKFSRPRDPAKIEISAVVQGGEIVFCVRDNGVGFNPDYADKLFGVFQRLHPVNEFEGSGIGLANVRRIIQRHGGRTWAEGRVDEGAAFYFSLPAP